MCFLVIGGGGASRDMIAVFFLSPKEETSDVISSSDTDLSTKQPCNLLPWGERQEWLEPFLTRSGRSWENSAGVRCQAVLVVPYILLQSIFRFFSTARKIKASGIFEFAATEIPVVLTVLVVTVDYPFTERERRKERWMLRALTYVLVNFRVLRAPYIFHYYFFSCAQS